MARFRFSIPERVKKAIDDMAVFQLIMLVCLIIAGTIVWRFSQSTDKEASYLLSGTWLSFWGSFLGGVFTLIAFVFTFTWEKNKFEIEREERREERRNNAENKMVEEDLKNFDSYDQLLREFNIYINGPIDRVYEDGGKDAVIKELFAYYDKIIEKRVKARSKQVKDAMKIAEIACGELFQTYRKGTEVEIDAQLGVAFKAMGESIVKVMELRPID